MTIKTIYLSFDLSDEEFKIYKNHTKQIDDEIIDSVHNIIKQRNQINKIMLDIRD